MSRLHSQYGYLEYYDALSTDPEFLEFFAAYLAIADTAHVPHEWAESVCRPIDATDGSTP